MKIVVCLLASASLLALASCSSMKPKSKPDAVGLSSGKFKCRIAQTADINYLVHLPKGYDPKSNQRWPLMLFLHGAGERGTDVQRVGIHGPLGMVKKGTDFPFIIVGPQCHEGKLWSSESVLALLDHVTEQFPVDTNRIYLTGLSMGGYGTWRLGLAHPEKFAAIVPICGGGSLIEVILGGRERPALKNLPVWAFHGAKDAVVPVEESERMVNALKKIGAKEVKLTVYPDAGHDSWTETYDNPEVYEWLLTHERRR